MGAGTSNSRRIGQTKSRSGCKICKIRKVKCGEEKPACVRCSSTGRRCEYEENGTPPKAPSTPSSLIPSHTPSLSPNSGRRERRAFEYYFQHAAKYLAGGMNIDFWTDVVPQICRTEPAVWDAMIAISGLFEYPDQCTDFIFLKHSKQQSHHLNQAQQEALTWYSRSMSGIHSQIERGSADPYVALISCVLFICIETIQGRMEGALRLYKQGVTLILDLRTQVALGGVTATKTALLEHTIIPLFLRLGTISLTISGVQPSELFAFSEHGSSTKFTSIISARSTMTILATEVILFEREGTVHLRAVGGEAFIQPYMVAKKQCLQNRLDDWYRAYAYLCRNIQAGSASSSPLLSEPILLTYHAAASIMLSGSLTDLETVYDAHHADFVTIIEQADLVLGTSAGPDAHNHPLLLKWESASRSSSLQ
ncbi:uncharacterized protein N7482_006024 [Penicillium canariense]|uniref:Zn(2)-C6 fungal-type domain-containing protein n=1 Tax=Penicillium canariense TaxID=189055 RepID=A0A9W9LP06_9EURO|nr:uncharacterized protein N7482_006024 [Penicillium canariense]KAJ5167243.1 hypothetical protein N7482_006024 [Penicillium canariense]